MSTANGKPGHLGDRDSARLIVRVERGGELADNLFSRLDHNWRELSLLADQGDGVDDYLTRLQLLNTERAGAIEAALAEARLAPDDTTNDQVEPVTEGEFSLGLMSTADFFAETYSLEWLIKGVLVAGQACVFGGPQKSLKTSIIVDQVISLGTGTPFLGRFEVPEPVPSMLISGESGKAVIQANAKEVCRAREIEDPSRMPVYWGFEPPQLCNSKHLAAVARDIKRYGFKVAVFDPLYLSLLAGNSSIDPKDMFQMGPLLADVAAVCLDAGATPELAHHFVKRREDPWGPPDMVDLAGAGIGQFMRQWLLTSRRERYNPEGGVHRLFLAYGGSAGHSGEMHLDIDTGVVGDDFRGRKWEVTVVPPMLSRISREQEQKAEIERKRAETAAQRIAQKEAETRQLMDEAEDQFRNEPGRKMTVRRLRDLTGWRKDKADHVLAQMGKLGWIRPATVEGLDAKGRMQSNPGFELVEPVGGVL